MRIAIVVAAMLTLVPVPAGAIVYCVAGLGNSGCPWQEPFPKWQLQRLSCQELRHLRNLIHDWRGFCFKAQADIETFDNSDCSVWDAGKIPFNSNEQTNLSRIRSIEATSCNR